MGQSHHTARHVIVTLGVYSQLFSTCDSIDLYRTVYNICLLLLLTSAMGGLTYTRNYVDMNNEAVAALGD